MFYIWFLFLSVFSVYIMLNLLIIFSGFLRWRSVSLIWDSFLIGHCCAINIPLKYCCSSLWPLVLGNFGLLYIFSFNLKFLKISLLISSLTIQVIQKYVIFQIFDCPNAFLSLLSDFILLWLENMLFMTCIFVILLRFALCSEYGLFGKCIVYNWKECFRLLLREVFYKC